MIKKREIDKFPYDVSEGLTEHEAKDNISKTGKGLLEIIKIYGPTVLRIAFVVYLLPESALADETPASSPGGYPTQLQVLPATKEVLGIAACVVAIGAKGAGKL